MEEETTSNRKLKVAIVGGGLVGSMSACFFAKRGFEVHLYEYRNDIRKTEHVKGRSINLAMSTRARMALKELGLEDKLIKHHGIPMKARMIHNLDGSRHPISYDPTTNKCIYSVSRRYLNEVLLSATEKYSNVTLHFNHKLVKADLKQGRIKCQRTDTKEIVEQEAALIVGADGAFSAVRREFMKEPMFDYSQTYIEHGYLELSIPPGQNGEFLMEPNYLHIWPRGTFMMIALPNQDRSWTVTLFMPFPDFEALDTSTKLLGFFSKYFPDSIQLIGRERLVTEFFATKPSFLLSIKSKPYHLGNKAVLIGDAAHAMVPFYGQGMNAGFEDCQLLDKLIMQHDFDLSVVLEQFSAQRCEDAAIMCDLAMYNYIEMRDLVNRPSFLLRKKLDNFFFWLLPKTWVPLYTSVTFTNMKYSQCIKNKQWQDKIVKNGTFIVTTTAASVLLFGMHTLWKNHLIQLWY